MQARGYQLPIKPVLSRTGQVVGVTTRRGVGAEHVFPLLAHGRPVVLPTTSDGGQEPTSLTVAPSVLDLAAPPRTFGEFLMLRAVWLSPSGRSPFRLVTAPGGAVLALVHPDAAEAQLKDRTAGMLHADAPTVPDGTRLPSDRHQFGPHGRPSTVLCPSRGHVFQYESVGSAPQKASDEELYAEAEEGISVDAALAAADAVPFDIPTNDEEALGIAAGMDAALRQVASLREQAAAVTPSTQDAPSSAKEGRADTALDVRLSSMESRQAKVAKHLQAVLGEGPSGAACAEPGTSVPHTTPSQQKPPAALDAARSVSGACHPAYWRLFGPWLRHVETISPAFANVRFGLVASAAEEDEQSGLGPENFGSTATAVGLIATRDLRGGGALRVLPDRRTLVMRAAIAAFTSVRRVDHVRWIEPLLALDDPHGATATPFPDIRLVNAAARRTKRRRRGKSKALLHSTKPQQQLEEQGAPPRWVLADRATRRRAADAAVLTAAARRSIVDDRFWRACLAEAERRCGLLSGTSPALSGDWGTHHQDEHDAQLLETPFTVRVLRKTFLRFLLSLREEPNRQPRSG